MCVCTHLVGATVPVVGTSKTQLMSFVMAKQVDGVDGGQMSPRLERMERGLSNPPLLIQKIHQRLQRHWHIPSLAEKRRK